MDYFGFEKQVILTIDMFLGIVFYFINTLACIRMSFGSLINGVQISKIKSRKLREKQFMHLFT